MRRRLPLALILTLWGCGGGGGSSSPTAPTPPAPPAPATWSVTGLVRAEPELSPLAGARVEVVEGPDAGRSTQTGADGRYELGSLREGSIALRVSAEGFQAQTRTIPLTANLTVDFSMRRPEPAPPPGRALSGSLIDGLTDGSIGGATLNVQDLGVFTTGSDGRFRIEAPDPERLLGVTILSPSTVTRSTHLRIPGPDAQVTMIPGSFDLVAFDQMFRGSGRLARWVNAPRLVIQTRVLQFTTVTAPQYTAIDAVMSDAEVNLLVEDLSWGLPQLTGGRLAFASQQRETAASGASVPVIRPGEIVVARYQGLQAATTFWGYGRWASDGTGTITGGIIMLDAGFETSGSQFRRSLRVHELGHALGYNHVTARPSVMNSSARLEPNEFDLNGARLAFLRPPGNRSPDTDPDAFSTNLRGIVVWYGSH